jgi:hypothetical protein
MGTLTYGGGKPYGYAGRPGTCRWCGDKLRRTRVTAGDSDKANPTYQEEVASWATVMADTPGAYQNGFFCSLRCGFQWAVRRLNGG